jgi:hypothetical protein
MGGHQALAVVEHVGDVPGVGRHRRDPDEGAAVQVEMAGLGDRDGVPALELGHDGPDHRALLLDRADLPEEQIELERTHVHLGLRPW